MYESLSLHPMRLRRTTASGRVIRSQNVTRWMSTRGVLKSVRKRARSIVTIPAEKNVHQGLTHTTLSAGWPPPTTTVDHAWDSPERRLGDQARSGSRIAEILAELGHVLEDGQDSELATIEQLFHARSTLRRIRSVEDRRRQRTHTVDTQAELRHLLDRLVNLDHSQAQVVVDCEGLNVRRYNTIDILELYVVPFQRLYLVGVSILGPDVWSLTATNSTFCLREFLSNTRYKKIMWDLRADAHVLKHWHNVQLSGIIDCSLWLLASRRVNNPSSPIDYRVSVEDACEHELRTHRRIGQSELDSLKQAKTRINELRPRPWFRRPINDILKDYAADVRYMWLLYRISRRSLRGHPAVVQEVEQLTEQDLEIACSQHYVHDGDAEPYSPWRPGYLHSWREGVKTSEADMRLRTVLTNDTAFNAFWMSDDYSAAREILTSSTATDETQAALLARIGQDYQAYMP